MSILVREEIELAKAEVTTKVNRLVRGAVVGVAAGVFVITALLFGLHGLSWLAWYVLPVGYSEYFVGFFVVAGILLILGIIAGLVAYRAITRGTPPTPQMAIDEARLIRETVSPQDGSAS